MKTINKIKKELNCEIKKYSFFNNIKYIETDLGNFIIKKCDNDNVYKNLERNNFDNYVDYKYEIDNYKIYPYIDSIEVDDNEKALDIIHLMTNLHQKTSYYKNISINEIKDIYEQRKSKIKELNDYYEYLRFIIEEKINLTPTELYFLKNMSIIFISLDNASRYLDKWYSIMQNKTSQRISLIHNNLDLTHIIENNKPYLISWDKSKYDIPIYDFISFYKKEFNELDFVDLLDIYCNNVHLLEEELYLLYVEILMPAKIIFDNSEIKNIYDLTYQTLYLNKTNYLILKNDKINKSHQNN